MTTKLKSKEIENEFKISNILDYPTIIDKYKIDDRKVIQNILKKYSNIYIKHLAEQKRIVEISKFENKYAMYDYICGIDEVGRGCLAGPVVACAVIMKKDFVPIGVKDSKKLSAVERERLEKIILENALAVEYSVISEKIIDEINILNATKMAMITAVSSLSIKPNVLLIDAIKLDLDIEQEAIINGDNLSYSIACSSILAKVYRDRLMQEYHASFLPYNFAQNKGYGTNEHIEAIFTHGITEIHRKSFLKKFNL